MQRYRNPIRVLQVVGSMNYGGAESMLMNWYRHIDKDKVQFDFLVRSQDKAAYDDEILSLGGRIYHTRPFRGYNPISYYNECRRFFAVHSEHPIVHGHIGSSASLYLTAAKKAGKYTIAHSHNANTGHDLKNFAYAVWSYPTRFIADELFACSTAAGVSRFGRRAIKKPNYRLFPNGVDINKFIYSELIRKEVGSEFGIDNDAIVLGAVGRIEKQKNPAFILEVFKAAVRENSKVLCLWVGTGDLEAICKENIFAAGLNNRIQMIGRRDDVFRLLQRMDCFIMPSFFEGLPVSAVEAQCAGLPCILSTNITREAAVSDQVLWKSLDDSPEQWAKDAIDSAISVKQSRTSPIDSIRNAGFDILTSTMQLEEFYLEHAAAVLKTIEES